MVERIKNYLSCMQSQTLKNKCFKLCKCLNNINNLNLSMSSNFRYDSKTTDIVSIVEQKFRDYFESKHTLCVNSCGSALFLAMQSFKFWNLLKSNKVFTNAFTFNAVPSSIVHANLEPVLVESSNDLCINLDDFKHKILQNPNVNLLVLSYMRGRTPDLDQLFSLCREYSIYVIEDCAHAMGSTWSQKKLGLFGDISCFSMQSNKLLDSGEGGLIITNNQKHAIYCTIASGCYEKLYTHHDLDEDLTEMHKKFIPNFSLRMSNPTAKILLQELKQINSKIKECLEKYQEFTELIDHSLIQIIPYHPKLNAVPNSIQAKIQNVEPSELINSCKEKNINIGNFADENNARNYKYWKFIEPGQKKLTDQSICNVYDIKLKGKNISELVDNLHQIIRSF